MAPQISIILPTFNGERYIGEAITSCLAQSFTDFELIIVNDCSTDATLSIINSFAKNDDRIHVINNSTNQKLPKSLNIGFKAASGKYYTWTSDDNIFDETALETMFTEISKTNSADIVYTAYRIVDERNNFVTNYGGNPEQLLFQNIVGACFLFKYEVYKRLNGFDEKKYMIEDYDFWLRALKYFTFKFIDEILYTYRRHSGSISSKIYNSPNIFNDFKKQHEQIFRELYSNVFRDKLTEYEIHTLTMIYFNTYLKDNIDLTINHYSKCIQLIDKLKHGSWNQLQLNQSKIIDLLESKKESIVHLYIRDLFYWKNEFQKNKTWFRQKYITPSFWLYKARNYFFKVTNQTKRS